jgi:hypothetical protein
MKAALADEQKIASFAVSVTFCHGRDCPTLLQRVRRIARAVP